MELAHKHPLTPQHLGINKSKWQGVIDVCELVHPTQREEVHPSVLDISLNLRKVFLLGTVDPSFGLQPPCRHCRKATAYQLSCPAWTIRPSSFRSLPYCLDCKPGPSGTARTSLQEQRAHLEALPRSFEFSEFLSINNNRTWPSLLTLALKAKLLIYSWDLL